MRVFQRLGPFLNPAVAKRAAFIPDEIPLTTTHLMGDALLAACIPIERLPHWIICDNPSDFPGKWTARLAFAFDPPEITSTFVVGDTREEVEACIPLIDQGRWSFIAEHSPENPQIVGCWI